METMELHRGRLIDHIQLVVRDLAASRRFYQAVFDTIGIPIAGEGDDYFWADELFISSASSEAAAAAKATKLRQSLQMLPQIRIFRVWTKFFSHNWMTTRTMLPLPAPQTHPKPPSTIRRYFPKQSPRGGTL